MRITASQLRRALHCTASCILPADDAPDTDVAIRGRALHAAVEGRHEDVPEEHRAEAESLDIDALGLPADVHHEVAFAFDAEAGTGRLLDVEGRDYASAGLRPHEVPGRADLWAPGYVGDLKSGWREVPAPASNEQLLVAAAANCSIYSLTECRVEILDIRDPASPRSRASTVDVFDLTDIQGRIAGLHRSVAKARENGAAESVEGPWCDYCPCMMACPAKRQLLARAQDGSLEHEIEVAWAGALTPASAPIAYRQLQQMKRIVKRAEGILYAYAKEHPIELGGGKVFGARTVKGNERLDGEIAWQVLKEQYGPDVAEAAVKFVASKSGIRNALRVVSGKGELSKREKAVIETIRERGGSERRETTRVEEYTRR